MSFIRPCWKCKYCRDVERAKETGCSNDCFYMYICDPIGGKDYWEEQKNETIERRLSEEDE